MPDRPATKPLPPARDDEAIAGALPPGTDLGQYVLERPLGAGGGGIVYVGRHHALRQRVAIKVLRGDLALSTSTFARFVREVEALNRIRHPNIVAIHEFADQTSGPPYYVMELLEGENLTDFLKRHGRFSPRETLELFEPVCAAIAAAHMAGMVHRDIKTSNVMIVERDGRRVVKLLDFGIAKMLHSGEALGQGLTEPGTPLGTARNMAPEQVRGELIDERADIYALGILLYQLLTGEYPFDAEDPRHIARMHLQTPAPRPSAIAPGSAEIDAVVLRCLEKQPERRFPSVAALSASFAAAADSARSETADSCQAAAVYLELTMDPEAEADPDDELLDDMLGALDLARTLFVEEGYLLPLETSNALLAVQLAAGGDAEAERTRAHELARTLAARLARRPLAHPALAARIATTAGAVSVRRAAGKLEVVGGPLLELESWVDEHLITPN